MVFSSPVDAVEGALCCDDVVGFGVPFELSSLGLVFVSSAWSCGDATVEGFGQGAVGVVGSSMTWSFAAGTLFTGRKEVMVMVRASQKAGKKKIVKLKVVHFSTRPAGCPLSLKRRHSGNNAVPAL